MRRFLSILSVSLLLLGIAAAARAGGSWLEPPRERFEPGDVVEFSATVTIGQHGWLEDGPFFAYLRGPEGTATDPVGKLLISEKGSSADVSIGFTLAADIPPGEYRVEACNDPCTTGLEDLVGGVLYVAVDPPDPSADPASQRAYQALAPPPARQTGFDVAWLAVPAALSLTVLVLAGAIRGRN
ncbi:MAG: hypothetical protein QNJ77_07425 [Acidimicrobiia bacterium]|nr:hypothetical protein [Acidimicrobiia bacterium]